MNKGIEHPIKQNQEQYLLNLKQSKWGFWFRFQYSLFSLEKRLEAMPFLKHFINVFSVVVLISSGSMLLFLFYVFSERLPNEMPLFFSQEGQRWSVYPTHVNMILVVGLMALGLIIYFFSMKIYNFDRRLSIFLNIFIVCATILFSIAYWQFFLLVLV